MIRRACLLRGCWRVVLAAAGAPGAAKVPHVKHVFIVVLENENASTTFGKVQRGAISGADAEEEGRLRAELLRHRPQLASTNYIAMVSGQSPNIQTQADCQVYNDVTPGTPARRRPGARHRVRLPDGRRDHRQPARARGLPVEGYMEDMNANAPKGQQSPCRHPAIGERDPWQSATPTDEYATRHNPFVYFHSLIDFQRTCRQHDVDYTHLRQDLRHRSDRPQLLVHLPGLCNDGHDAPCANGEPGGLVSANRWLRRAVPTILHSPAFKHRGLLIVTFDEAEATGSEGDSSGCCGEQPGPSIVPPDTPGLPDARTRRRARRRGDGLALHQAQDGEQAEVQPLLAAALDGEQLPASLPGLRGTGRPAPVRLEGPEPPRLSRSEYLQGKAQAQEASQALAGGGCQEAQVQEEAPQEGAHR